MYSKKKNRDFNKDVSLYSVGLEQSVRKPYIFHKFIVKTNDKPHVIYVRKENSVLILTVRLYGIRYIR